VVRGEYGEVGRFQGRSVVLDLAQRANKAGLSFLGNRVKVKCMCSTLKKNDRDGTSSGIDQPPSADISIKP